MLFSYLFKSSLLFLSPFCILAVLESINMKKGGPRTSLYDLCKRLQWPMPTFKTTEHKSRLVKDEAILINLIFYTFSGILNYNFQLLLVLSVSRIAYAYRFSSTGYSLMSCTFRKFTTHQCTIFIGFINHPFIWVAFGNCMNNQLIKS